MSLKIIIAFFTLNNLLFFSFLDKKLLSKYSINADKKTGSSFDIIQIKRFGWSRLYRFGNAIYKLSRMFFLCFWYKGHSRVKCSSSSIELLVQCWQSLSHLVSNSSFPEVGHPYARWNDNCCQARFEFLW